MDRRTIYRDEIPFETDILGVEQFVHEGLGLLIRDLCGDTMQVGGFPCVPTAPPSMNVEVGPGRVYKLEPLESTTWGERLGTGGLPADTDAEHYIIKQGLLRETTTFNCPAPVTVGHSIKYLIEASFAEVDDADETLQFYNVANPLVPTAADVSPNRRNVATLYLIAGVSGASPTIPATTAGRVPVWVVTVAYGATTIGGGDIALHGSAPYIAAGGGGGGGSLPPWSLVTGTATAVAGGRYLAKTSGGAFTLTLPAAPAGGTEVWIKGSWLTNNLTIARNGQTINGSATDLTGDKDNQTLILVFDGTTWEV